MKSPIRAVSTPSPLASISHAAYISIGCVAGSAWTESLGSMPAPQAAAGSASLA